MEEVLTTDDNDTSYNCDPVLQALFHQCNVKKEYSTKKTREPKIHQGWNQLK